MVGHAAYNGITMRVLAQYDINAGGLVVNCDILAGVAVLNSGLLGPRARLILSQRVAVARPGQHRAGRPFYRQLPPGGRRCLMDFLLFAQADTFADAISVLKQYGPLVLVVAFLLWQGWVREARMSKRIAKLEDEQRTCPDAAWSKGVRTLSPRTP